MPTRAVIPIHGSDHCPGGPDPIPCLESGAVGTIDWIMGWQTARRTSGTAEETIASWDVVNMGGTAFAVDGDNKPQITEVGIYLIEIAGDWGDSTDDLDSSRGYWALTFTDPPDTFFWQTIGGLAGSTGPYRAFDWSAAVGQQGYGQLGSNVQLIVTAITDPATVEVKLRAFVPPAGTSERYQFGYSIIRLGAPS